LNNVFLQVKYFDLFRFPVISVLHVLRDCFTDASTSLGASTLRRQLDSDYLYHFPIRNLDSRVYLAYRFKYILGVLLFLVCLGVVRMSPFGAPATVWPIVIAPDGAEPME
jgi:hypothetical protein